MHSHLFLLLKLAAASLTGMAAFVACRNMCRNDTLQTQLHDIRNSLRNVTSPPTIYVIGFKSRGKSSFVNTACRVLEEEEGPLVFRAETAPVGPTRTTMEPTTVHVAGIEGCGVTLVDTPGLPVRVLTRADVEAVLRRIPAAGSPSPECVVVVLRCTDLIQRLSDMKLAEIVAVVRERGLHFIVVLTHKKALTSMKQMAAIRKEVAIRARTDCIYFIENYTVGSTMLDRRLISIRNNFDTHNVTLAIIRQCVEFAIIHRSDFSSRTSGVTPAANRVPTSSSREIM